jgi:hypothetical protein
MPSKDIESILGKGELVDNSVVVRALGSPPATYAWLCEEGERGLWVQWKYQNRTMFVQFGGPTVVQNKDGLYSIGPNTQCGLVLFMTENPSGGSMTENPSGGMREEVDIDYKLGPRRGHLHRVQERLSISIVLPSR